MKEPTPRISRLAVAGGALAVLVFAGAGYLAGRGSVAPTEVPTTTSVGATRVVPPPAPPPALPAQLDRAGLLALVAAAADAAAGDRPAPAGVAQAAGRHFSIALPFGCAGPLGATDATSTGWHYDADRGALRLQVASTRWVPEDWFGESKPTDVEAVEGFWVPRPWTSAENCPAAAAPATTAGIEPVTLAGQSLAIGQMFGKSGSRQDQRDGEPYVAVIRTAPDAMRASAGFRVRLTGQLTDLPGSGAVRCRQPGGPDQRPICLVGATLDEIAIENAATGETLARWPGGSGRGQ